VSGANGGSGMIRLLYLEFDAMPAFSLFSAASRRMASIYSMSRAVHALRSVSSINFYKNGSVASAGNLGSMP
jgi:hypothetical protein